MGGLKRLHTSTEPFYRILTPTPFIPAWVEKGKKMLFVIRNGKYKSYLRVEDGKCYWDSYFRTRPDRPTTIFQNLSELITVVAEAAKARPDNWPPIDRDWVMEQVEPVRPVQEYRVTGIIIA